jgi:hypothetical protein
MNSPVETAAAGAVAAGAWSRGAGFIEAADCRSRRPCPMFPAAADVLERMFLRKWIRNPSASRHDASSMPVRLRMKHSSSPVDGLKFSPLRHAAREGSAGNGNFYVYIFPFCPLAGRMPA